MIPQNLEDAPSAHLRGAVSINGAGTRCNSCPAQPRAPREGWESGAEVQDEERAGRIRYVVVADEEAGRRVDNFLFSRYPRVARSHLYRIIRGGEVRVNSGRVKPASRLAAGDRVRIVVPWEEAAAPSTPLAPTPSLVERLRSAIVFENRDLLVLDKPAGLAVHGGSGVRGNLIQGLRGLYPRYVELGLVHRLDRDTSGCLLVAKRHSALRFLHEELRARRIERLYLLLVAGNWPADCRRVAAPLHKYHLQGERRVRVASHGKSSLTRFRVVRRFPRASLLLAAPHSGRTHQIRVHAAHAGFPLAGDQKYGSEEENRRWRGLGLRRLFLHAVRLRFPVVPGDYAAISAPLPGELRAVLGGLEKPPPEMPIPPPADRPPGGRCYL